jgi:hypothetical protein
MKLELDIDFCIGFFYILAEEKRSTACVDLTGGYCWRTQNTAIFDSHMPSWKANEPGEAYASPSALEH